MIAHDCSHERRRKHGTTKGGAQRFRCRDCGKTFTESTDLFNGMRIGLDKAEQIVKLLVDGMSVSAVCRFTEIDKKTVLDLLVLVGERCKQFLETEIRDVIVEDVQIDEVWQYIYAKQKTCDRKDIEGKVGDSYTFTAVERTTKLVLAWHFGRRDQYATDTFCEKLRDATAGRFHLSSDGFAPYRQAVPMQLGSKVDFGMLIKIFGAPSKDDQRKYSPAQIISTRKEAVWGNPDKDRICTSHTERANGTMRNFIKRMCRLTYCFSKKWENHEAALGLYFAHYNFCRKHRTLKTTPAVASGLAHRPWTVRELIERTCNT